MPVTSLVGFASIALSLSWWAGFRIDALLMEPETYARAELWRLLSSALVHADLFHLGFNLVWLWSLGFVIERDLGSVRTLLLYVFITAGASAIQWHWAGGGIGLSGLVYGQATLLWVGARYRPAFAQVDSRANAWWLGGWFVVCVVMTQLGYWHIGNAAHAGGALCGALAALTLRPRRQPPA